MLELSKRVPVGLHLNSGCQRWLARLKKIWNQLLENLKMDNLYSWLIQVASKGSLVAGRVSKKQTLRDTASGRKVFAFTLTATSGTFCLTVFDEHAETFYEQVKVHVWQAINYSHIWISNVSIIIENMKSIFHRSTNVLRSSISRPVLLIRHLICVLCLWKECVLELRKFNHIKRKADARQLNLTSWKLTRFWKRTLVTQSVTT